MRVCSNLEENAIPEGVTDIGIRAFKDCSSLRSIKIPAGTTRIGYAAFDGCHDKLVIYGKDGSDAQQYAEKNKIAFLIQE